MCGIIAYAGTRASGSILLQGLHDLEYRGYDSAGVGFVSGGALSVYKQAGKVSHLENFLHSEQVDLSAQVGIAHTRWATHGPADNANAHPHRSKRGKLAIVHNGVVENCADLRDWLQTKGYTFSSCTDTEVLVNLIEEIWQKETCIERAVQKALAQVVGHCACVLLSVEHPDRLLVAKRGSPLLMGQTSHGLLIASDASALTAHTDRVYAVGDGHVGLLSAFSPLSLLDAMGRRGFPSVQRIEMAATSTQRGPYAHHMLKEIYEQPEALRRCLQAWKREEGAASSVHHILSRIYEAPRIIMVACGTSRHACLAAAYLWERLCGIPVQVEYASEFATRAPVLRTDDVLIAVSQSGETADTRTAVELAVNQGVWVVGICNVAGSSIDQAVHARLHTWAGTEVSVASTKAFTTQLTVLTALAIEAALRYQRCSTEAYETLQKDLDKLPGLVQQTIDLNEPLVQPVAQALQGVTRCLYVGRGPYAPVALEGALKLKELAYLSAEGYPAGELKHGPLALVDADTFTVVIAPKALEYEKTNVALESIRARGGPVIALITEGDVRMERLANYVLKMPALNPVLAPIVSAVPLQLLAYQAARLRGCDVDRPRNLAKSVTVV